MPRGILEVAEPLLRWRCSGRYRKPVARADERAAIVSRGGPKHGPHLNVSYRAEKGKTTGYYVPQAAAEATRQGVAPGKNCKSVCANWESSIKERNLRQAREADSR